MKTENPFSLIFRLYQQQFLNKSIQSGLINTGSLTLAGDGTLSEPLQEAEINGFVIVKRTVFVTVIVNAITISLTVTGDGIPPANVISMAITYTCSLLLIRRAICLFSLSLNELPGMICFLFCIPSFP